MNKKILGILVCTLLMIVTVSPALGSSNSENTVLYNNPPEADAGGPYNAEEGTEVIFDASGSHDPDGDVLLYIWDFDGDAEWDTDWLHESFISYSYGDDYEGIVNLAVTDGSLIDYDHSSVLINNVAPTADAVPDQTVNEGEEFNFDFSFTDPGFSDEHIICFSADSGEGDFKPPTGVQGGWYPLSDSRIGEYIIDTGSMELNDIHLSPRPGSGVTILTTPTNWTKKSSEDANCSKEHTAQPGTTLTFKLKMKPNATTGRFMCDIYFTLDYSIIGEGWIDFELNTKSTPMKSYSLTQFEFTYGDDGTYRPVFNVSDDDGGYSEVTCTITVLNSPPEIEPFGPFKGKPNEPIELSATATDPGSDDLTFTWGFGDGTPVVTNTYYNNGESPDSDLISQFGTFPFTITDTVEHTYESKGTYIVKLTVEDDNGGIDEYTTSASMPRNKPYTDRPFLKFLQNIMERFPLFARLLKL
jgi:hypothetical protein